MAGQPPKLSIAVPAPIEAPEQPTNVVRLPERPGDAERRIERKLDAILDATTASPDLEPEPEPEPEPELAWRQRAMDAEYVKRTAEHWAKKNRPYLKTVEKVRKLQAEAQAKGVTVQPAPGPWPGKTLHTPAPEPERKPWGFGEWLLAGLGVAAAGAVGYGIYKSVTSRNRELDLALGEAREREAYQRGQAEALAAQPARVVQVHVDRPAIANPFASSAEPSSTDALARSEVKQLQSRLDKLEKRKPKTKTKTVKKTVHKTELVQASVDPLDVLDAVDRILAPQMPRMFAHAERAARNELRSNRSFYRGPAGPAGPRGKGTKGDKGDKGDKGEDASLMVKEPKVRRKKPGILD